ncbi:phage tail protein [Sulfitobacter aestuariivivens]|uniref:Phage tail protein n=1 Tax=Sulfitobacter aestuariivivens TaxID=2766981 RepID=A0A927D0B4_9RHOB|nr:tail fiber protein [Sulfitobacter aestuariivivens]MBD3662700.1 phage tail protein [Sulfitobacter aestuariivivens]
MTLSKKLTALAAPIVVTLGLSVPQQAQAQATPFIGQLMLVGNTFCPRGWAEANGQLLAISSNTPLFSLLGTNFGGDGRTTFALPDLRGRVPMHAGAGPGLTPRSIGQEIGQERVTLSEAEMPQHRHIVNSTFADGDKNGPGSDFLAVPSDAATGTKYDDLDIYHNGPPDRTMDPNMIAFAGGNQSHDNMSPTLVMRWCVALDGLYPSRN